jgi:hypothetical protein
MLLLLTSVPLAFPCADPRLRDAVIGGHVIQAGIATAHKPLRYVRVRLYSGRNLIWAGTTDKDGKFTINHLPSGKYRLFVTKWGSVNVELKPELDVTGLGQRPSYSLLLFDDTCVAVTTVVN